jgi:glycogen(starch) synthase
MSPIPDGRPLTRILMTTDTVGGVWDYSLQLAEALSSRGIALTLAAMGPTPTRDQQRAAAYVPGLELLSRECRLEWMDDPWSDVASAGDWLLGLEAQVSPDVVHLNGYVHGSLPWRAPVLVVGHSCVYSWWTAVRAGSPSTEWRAYRDKVCAGLCAAGAVATPSRMMAEALAQHYGRHDSVVIPNGRDPRYFSPGPKGTFVFCAGRLWDEGKNVRLLTSAARQLPWPVYIAGETSTSSSEHWEAAGVHALGRLPSSLLRHWLACASIYALPAKYEPFGLTVLEAALCRCALVLGDIPSLRENWEGAATFVPTDDPEALVFAVRKLTDQQDHLADLAHKASVRAETLSVDRMVQGYVNVYASLLESPVPVPLRQGSSCAS